MVHPGCCRGRGDRKRAVVPWPGHCRIRRLRARHDLSRSPWPGLAAGSAATVGGNNLVIHAVLICGLLACAWATDEIGLHVVFGAVVFGTIVPKWHIDAMASEIPERIDQTSLLLLPVFFTVTGLSVDFGGLGWQGLVIVVAVIVVACVGKFVGAASSARLTGATGRQSVVLGILLNARGLTELIILNVGLTLGVLDTRLFTAMVIMAIVTTLMTSPLLRWAHPAEAELSERHCQSKIGGLWMKIFRRLRVVGVHRRHRCIGGSP
jgi:Kef-type K+ transport system membrane component KefB